MFDISDIQQIKVICEKNSISQAAKVLNVSQSTLSKRVARLEQVLKAKLFHRSPQGLIPTRAALYIIESAHGLQDELKRIERHVTQMSLLERGDITIGVGPIVEPVLLPLVLPQFHQGTGDVRITVRTEKAEMLVNLLRASELDVIAGPFRAQDFGDDFIVTPLVSAPLLIMAAAQHPIFKLDEPNLADLQDYSFAAPALQGGMKTTKVSPLLADHGKRIVCENYHVVKSMLMQTDCLTIAPRAVYADDLASGELKVVSYQHQVTWDCACIVKPESIDAPLVKRFVNQLVAAAQSLG